MLTFVNAVLPNINIRPRQEGQEWSVGDVVCFLPFLTSLSLPR